MADEKTDQQTAPEEGVHQVSEADKKKARAWFKKAADEREHRNYDYAIEAFITGLGFWPEAVEEGHMPLYSLAIQRLQAGGKKPGLMEGMKKSMTAKDPCKAMLNAEALMAKDPTEPKYLEGVMKNAGRGGFFETLKWITPKVFDSLRKDKKPNAGRFKTFRQALAEAAENANAASVPLMAAYFYELAVNSIDYLMARNPGDDKLRDEQRDLSGRLTIARGKYGEAESFRESINDAESQKLLHDSERSKQGDETLEALIAAARKAFEAEPDVPGKIYGLVDALLRRDRSDEEDEAIEILTKAFAESNNYAFKSRADDIRLKQLLRQTRRCLAKAVKTGSDGDKQQARLAASEQVQAEVAVYRERVAKYPTDLRVKYRLGKALFSARQYDEAIPVLQEAQADPRTRLQCHLLMGRAFFENGSFTQAREVLKEALDEHDTRDDDTGKELMYWLARAYESNGEVDEAKDAFGKLLRVDYNFAKGDARKRLEALK
ncbi:MAG: tetratricopeptide repeat protein [Phycisphaerae bacterium]|nr:tetratricopeptide repeat protein [Phycisphaerae bacterium]